jgi:OmpA-OmpF porin, OOP family
MKLLPIAAFLLLQPVFVFAQDDVENCKDHPMFNRMPNTFITECSNNYDEVEFYLSSDNVVKKEGNKAMLHYGYNYDSKVAPPSFLQIVKNYENALAKYGGKRVFFGKELGRATLNVKNGGKDYWISLEDYGGVGEGQFGITVLEIEEMKQDITANVLADEMKQKGSVTLHINFETGKSEIKQESQSIIEQLAAMLQQDATLKVSVEGHTDNVGGAAANLALSENRARSVLNALAAKGIDKSRLTSKGWGQSKPVADNNTAEGKAANRRVEIVKL